MISLEDITDSVLLIRDHLIKKRSNKPELTLTDFQILYKFTSIFDVDDFRKGIRNHRKEYGSEQLEIDLKSLNEASKEFRYFYQNHKNKIDLINISNSIHEELLPFKIQIDKAYQELAPISNKMVKLNGEIESKSWKMSMNDTRIKELVKKKKILKENLKQLQSDYQEAVDKHKEELNKEAKVSSFLETNEKLIKISRIIESNYIDTSKIFKKKLSEESLECLNELFTPGFETESAMNFLNASLITNPNVKLKYRKEANAIYLIYKISELISDKKVKEIWVDDKCKILDIKKSTYSKKKKSCTTEKFKKKVNEILTDLK